jgi:Skp family chaperone for outer membrane proteins
VGLPPLTLADQAVAQDAPEGALDSDALAEAGSTGTTPILTLDQDRFFRESLWGRAALSRAEAETAALAAENRRIESALETEERDLTDRRPTMSADEFGPLAEAFDAKVEEIRAAQDAKSRAITRQLEEDRQRFFEAALPVLGQLLEVTGGLAILSDQAIILSRTSIDVTDTAIERMNEALPAPEEAMPPGGAPAMGDPQGASPPDGGPSP